MTRVFFGVFSSFMASWFHRARGVFHERWFVVVKSVLAFFTIVLEVFPVSSSGHLRLLAPVFGVLTARQDHLLHIFFLIALAGAFFPAWGHHGIRLMSIARRPALVHRESFRRYLALVGKIIATVLFIDCITYSVYVLRGSVDIPLAGGFMITGVLLILSGVFRRTVGQPLTVLTVTLLALAQSISLFAGVSRLGATYALGRLCGMTGRRSLEYSFLMQAPLIFGAALVAFLKLGTADIITILPGALVAMPLAFFFLLHLRVLALTDKLWFFGFYLLIPFLWAVQTCGFLSQ